MKYPAAFVKFCNGLKITLTSLRREVLYILWQSKKPLKAYQILDELLKIKPNSKPPSVYRALIFFAAHGIVHKIESIQSYILCCEPEERFFSAVLLVCDDCHHVTEIHHAVMQLLVREIAESHQFKLRQDVIELKGMCLNCQDKF